MLRAFVRESNRIEGIMRPPLKREIEAHELFLSLPSIGVPALEQFVAIIQPGARLRRNVGMDVRVGNHRPPPGGNGIQPALIAILREARDPYETHQAYETLHPFMDGNGRSGRVLWLHMMGGIDRAPLGFLHHWYYQSLSASRPAATLRALASGPAVGKDN